MKDWQFLSQPRRTQARKEAYQSADKKQIADYQKRKDAYPNQRVDDKKAMAARQGIACTGPQKKTPQQRALDRKIDTRNMHTRASLDKNIREGHVSKQEKGKGQNRNIGDVPWDEHHAARD